jgi:CRP/FNR family transcriptional regulator, anaerobic regulatory protein
LPERPRYAAAAVEDLLTGSRRLRAAFLETPLRFAGRDQPLIRAGQPDAPALLIRNGFAYRSCVLADGRRAILDILLAGDIAALDHVVLAHPIEDITTADRVGYHALDAAVLRGLMADQAIVLSVMSVVATARWRADRLAAAIGRLDAQAKICVMLLDIYERLMRRGLIGRPTFNLPLTQEQIADHLGLTLVHVNRTLRRLREAKIALIDRQVVIILDLGRLRELVRGLPQPADLLDALPPRAALIPIV